MPGSGIVLVIDDEPMVHRLARAALEPAGYKVEAAANGEEGLEVFSQCREDIAAILLDLTMPVMGGAEAIQRIRAIDQKVPVIASSGSGEEEKFPGILESGVCVESVRVGRKLVAAHVDLITRNFDVCDANTDCSTDSAHGARYERAYRPGLFIATLWP